MKLIFSEKGFAFGLVLKVRDRFPKRVPKAHASSEVRGLGWAPIGNFLDVYSLSPLSWVSELFRQDIGQMSTWKVF